MKIQLASANQGDARLARTVAITFIAAMAILALYFGQDVLIPVAVAVLFAFILGPAVSWCVVCCHCRLPWRWSCWGPWSPPACSPC